MTGAPGLDLVALVADADQREVLHRRWGKTLKEIQEALLPEVKSPAPAVSRASRP